ncbi:MAG: diguanylate cyclase [Campylobacterota bacterium]|nr:diguanylate cyclase [Campylobacterota bacterium]
MKTKFSIIFIAITIAIFFTLNNQKEKRINEFLNTKTEGFLHAYNIIYKQHKELSDMALMHITQEKRVIEIYKKLSDASSNEKYKLREELYDHLLKKFQNLEFYNINILHFHLPNSESFLRMHKPKKFGDSLLGIRDMVNYTNQHKKSIDGFEAGRLYNGYRFISPIVDQNNNHLGSIEVSFGAESFTRKIMKQYNTLSNFITSSDVINKKIWEKGKEQFTKSPYDGYYNDKTVLKVLKKVDIKEKRKIKPSKEFCNKAAKYIKKNKPITLYSSKLEQTITFIPIQNPITKDVVAFLTVRSDGQFISRRINNFYILFSISTLLIFMILFYLYKQSKSKGLIEHREELLQNIINTTKHLTVVTDFKNISFANRSFLEYFNLKKLDDFNNNYDKFCDLLLKKENYIHGNLLEDEDENFADLIERTDYEKQKVILLSPEITLDAFSISLEKINIDNKTLYLVTLIDITKQEIEKLRTEHKAYYDELTQVYNRNKLNEVFDSEIKKVKRFNHPLSIALIDVDHFKKFNDTFGHLIGDEVLILLAQTINKHLRNIDMFARWGGEEFIILFIETNIDDAMIASEKLRKIVESIKHHDAGHITSSFGVTQYKDGDDLKSIFKRCDKALYMAKENGRNRVEKI